MQRQVRADYDDKTIVVYQAYAPAIANAALRAGRFVAPYKRDRMTWIKPSFRWMMYRCGYATKPGQERVLGVRITRAGFEWALANSSLSHYVPDLYASRAEWAAVRDASPVRVQWDPERSLRSAPLDHRSIQIGLGDEAATRYVDEWIVSITDLTDVALAMGARVTAGDLDAAAALLPPERVYPLPDEVAARVGATD